MTFGFAARAVRFLHQIQYLILDLSAAVVADPVGESNSGALRLDFDRRLMLRFCGSAVTSHAGLLAYRELDDAVRLPDMAGDVLADARTGRNDRHALFELLRQSVFGRDQMDPTVVPVLRRRLTALAPILMSFSGKVVNDHDSDQAALNSGTLTNAAFLAYGYPRRMLLSGGFPVIRGMSGWTTTPSIME